METDSFIPKLNGFSEFDAPHDWVIKLDENLSHPDLPFPYNFYGMKVKDPETPLILRFTPDYHLELFFFKDAEFLIRYNKEHREVNKFQFDVNTIKSLHFPNA